MSRDPVFRRIDCLALPVTDLDDAIDFYGDLGHGVLWRTATGAGLGLGGSEAELVLQTERPGAETDLTVDDVTTAVERFVAADGRVVVEPFDIAIGRCAIVADPWDNHLVILDNSKGHLVTDEHGNVVGVSGPDEPPTPPKVREVIERLIRDGRAVARRDGSTHTLFPVAIGAEESAALCAWVVREAAVQTIEVGLGYGLSALSVCEGLLTNANPSARHLVIDPHQATRFANCGLQFLEEAGAAAMVDHLAEDSRIALPRLVAAGRSFDLAFVDGNHRFDGVFVDLAHLGRLLRPGGVVFLDDYQLPAVARAASFFATNLGWTIEEVSRIDDLHQWAVIRTTSEPDERPFDHFVNF